MTDTSQLEERLAREHGFTLIEVMISILITLIVMGAVFGLLTRGQRSFRREPEIADLQQSGRAALDMVSKDILQAGAGLPPEFPAFSRINGAGDNAPTDVLEIIGQFQSAGTVYLDPEEVMGFNAPDLVVLNGEHSNFDTQYPFNMVVIYNDDPANPRWKLAQVIGKTEIPGTNAVIQLDYGVFDAAYSNPPDGAALDPAQYPRNETQGIIPKVTRVSVVRYFTQTDNPGLYGGQPPEVLMRWVDFGINGQQPQPVGYLDDFQIAYVIGVTAPVEQDTPPDPVTDLGVGTPLTAENMLSSVRVTVTARSVSENMEGASQGASGDLIRKTFSTNVNPRNISSGVEARVMAATGP